jgi:protocatechuate 3,4-dioxygenase beta subunit
MRHLKPVTLMLFVMLAFYGFGRASLAQAQKEPGSITGSVKRDGKPAPGVTVMATPTVSDPAKAVEQMLSPSASIKATTDSEGAYKLEGLAPGKYTVSPSASPLISATGASTTEVTVSEGATTEGIDFALSLGGVITGKITDSEGRPVIAERILLKPLEKREPGSIAGSIAGMFGDRMYSTDDRGIYRIYGLRPGRYIVSTGKDSDVMPAFLSKHPKRVQTFYPGVTDETKATPIQVTAGGEVTGVDIQFGGIEKGFVVSGRVVDSDKGTPIANAMVAYSKAQKQTATTGASLDIDTGGVTVSGSPGGLTATNDKGEFRFMSVAPGSYRLETTSIGAIAGQGASQFYADPVAFEVTSANVDKLAIKVHRGAAITGFVVLESTDPQDSLERYGQLMLMATVIDSEKSYSTGNCMVGTDGTFKLGGLKPGKANIRPFSSGAKRPGLLRIERNGVELSEIEIHPNEEINGIKVVLASATCIIRGRVTIQGGNQPLPTIRVRAVRQAANPATSDQGDFMSSIPVEVDANGAFVIENLTPGTYQVEAFVLSRGARGPRPVSAKQTVMVANEQPGEVYLTLDLGKNSDK